MVLRYSGLIVSYKYLAVVLFEISQMFSLLLYLVFPNIIQVVFSYLLLKVPIIYPQVIGEIFANPTSIDLTTYETLLNGFKSLKIHVWITC